MKEGLLRKTFNYLMGLKVKKIKAREIALRKSVILSRNLKIDGGMI